MNSISREMNSISIEMKPISREMNSISLVMEPVFTGGAPHPRADGTRGFVYRFA
jgi:hypothetical protein